MQSMVWISWMRALNKDSTLIMQLLRDNLTLWNSSMADDDLHEQDYDDE